MGKLIRTGDPFSLYPRPDADTGLDPASKGAPPTPRAARWALRNQRLLKRSCGRRPQAPGWDPLKPSTWRRPH